MEKFGLLLGLLLLLHTSALIPPMVKEFIHVDTRLSWNSAQSYCRNRFQNLFTYSNENDLKNLTDSAKQLSWFGLYKYHQLWKWVDGSVTDNFNWYKLGNCAAINKFGFWQNRSCDDELYFVCRQCPQWDLQVTKKSWFGAKDDCYRNYSEKLAIIHDDTENNNISAVLNGKDAWIGLSRFGTNWQWEDMNPLTFSNWLTSFLCAVMDCQGVWRDTSCFDRNPFVCVDQNDDSPTYTLFSERKTWREARSHCEVENKKLAMVKTESSSTSLLNQICGSGGGTVGNFWIGLNNDPWIWSESWSNVRNWNSMQPDEKDFSNESLSHCGAVDDGEWFVKDCEEKLPFFCSVMVRSTILVSEPKSWIEALDHCRNKYVDLASLGSEAEQAVAVRKIEGVQSGYVWTGMRFLAGSWFWVYGDGIKYENWLNGVRQQCPHITLRCGALAVAGGKWEPRSCEEKLEFLCFQK